MTAPVALQQPVVVRGEEISGPEQRFRIDQIDTAITDLLKERASISHAIQRTRVRSGGSRVDLSRESEVVSNYRANLGSIGGDVANLVLMYCRGELTDAVRGQRQGQPVSLDGNAI